MSSPKHLWSGDWELDSAAAAEALANHRARAWPRSDEPDPRTPEPATPAPAARPASPPRPRRRRRRIPLPRPRVALLGAVALLLLASAAYGLSTLGGSSGATSKTPWLGARLQSWPAGGALVSSVSPGGPAAAAGLRSGDVIVQVQGRPVSAAVNVTEAVRALSAGDRLQILAMRHGRPYSATARLEARPQAAP